LGIFVRSGKAGSTIPSRHERRPAVEIIRPV
jgi:hypothetical protein